MTETRKEKLRTAVYNSRARIMTSNPVYALLLMCLKVVTDDRIKSVSVNGNCLFFNPDFLQKLYPRELDFVLIHQLFHIIRGDIWREKDLIGIDYHYACDEIINTKLIKDGIAEKSYPHLGKQSYLSNDDVVVSPMELYLSRPYNVSALPEDQQKKILFDTDERWSENYDFGQFGEVLIDAEKDIDERFFVKTGDKPSGDGGTKREGEEREGGQKGNERVSAKEKWQQKIEFAFGTVKETSKKGQGFEEEFEKLKIGKMRKAQLNWREILNDALSNEICDYSFSPPDKRLDDSPFFLPDFNEENVETKDVLFMVDTSASVNLSELTAAFSEIKGAIEQFNGKMAGKLGFFDMHVNKVVDFSSVDDVKNAIPLGGGGTCFYSVFDYVKEKLPVYNFRQIIILTDGEADFPEERRAIGIPVLWLINNETVDPPWGRVARIDPKK